jgi:hypothetical protein
LRGRTPRHAIGRADICKMHACRSSSFAPAAQGELVTNLMGEAAQQSFSRGWGVGLAVSQAAQFRDMFIIACQSALVLTVLETLWLVSNTPWVAEMIGALPSCCSDAHLTPGSMSSSGAYQLRSHGRSSAAHSHAPRARRAQITKASWHPPSSVGARRGGSARRLTWRSTRRLPDRWRARIHTD